MSQTGTYKVNKFKFVGLLIIFQIMLIMLFLILSALVSVENQGSFDIVAQIGFILMFIGCALVSVERR